MARSIVKKSNTIGQKGTKNFLIDQKTNRKMKKNNRLMLMINFLKEALLVVLFFIIVSSQLKTSKALYLREELSIRYDLDVPDYMNEDKAGFERINNFNQMYAWLNDTFLPRIFMDPFYKSLKSLSPDWPKPLKGSNVGMRINDQDRMQHEKAGETIKLLTDKESSNTKDNKEDQQQKKNESEEETEEDYGFTGEEFDIDILLKSKQKSLELLKEKIKSESDNEIKLLIKNLIKSLKDSILLAKIELQSLISDANKATSESPEEQPQNSLNATEEAASKDKGERVLQQQSGPKLLTSPNSAVYRLLQSKTSINQDSFYFQQMIFKTTSPFYYNKIFTPLRIVSRLRKQKSIKENLPDVITHELDQGSSPDMKYPYSSELEGYFYDMPVFGIDLKTAQKHLKDTLEKKLVNERSYQLEVSCASLNSNTYMISYINLSLHSSTSGMYERFWDIHTFRLDPYLHSHDMFRMKLEFIYVGLFLIFIFQEFCTLLNIIIRVNVFMETPPHTREQQGLLSRLSGAVWTFFNWLGTWTLRIIFGFLKYIYNFQNMLTFSGLICSTICIWHWTHYVILIHSLHKMEFNDLAKIINKPEYREMLVIIELASRSMRSYRKMTGLVAGIFAFKLAMVTFRFIPRLSYFFDSLIASLGNNLYYFFFLFKVNLGVAFFTHYYFGGSIDQFSTKSNAFIVVFATILGYTDGISLMLDAEPLIATITLEIYYFIVIMILINMFIIYVNSEFKNQEQKRMEYLRIQEQEVSKFDYPPFLLYRIKEAMVQFFTFDIYWYISKDTYLRLKQQREGDMVSHRLAQFSYQNIDWDVSFQRVRDINFKHNNSLAAIAKISQNEVLDILKDKHIRHIWKFCCLAVVLALHICIISVIYSPLESDYSILLSKVHVVLREASKQKKREITPIPFSDFHMRVFMTDLNNYWISERTTALKPLKIFQVHFQNENLKPVGSYFVEVKNVKIEKNKWKSHQFDKVAPLRYKDFDLSTPDHVTVDSELPSAYKDHPLKFSGLGYKDYKPSLTYRFDKKFQAFIANLDHTSTFADPFFVKLVADNVVGPYTYQVATKGILFNNITGFHIMAEVRLKRDLGDFYAIEFHYHQLSTHNMLVKYFYLFPVSVVIKSFVMMVLIFRTTRKIWRTNYEYNLWYKVGLENDMPRYLMQHRHRKMPEIFRKLSHLICIDDVLLWCSFIFFVVFWVFFSFQLFERKAFLESVAGLQEGSILTEETYFQGLKLAEVRFRMNFFAGFEVLMLTLAVLLSLRRIDIFKVILESFYIIFNNLAALVIIMTLLILTFAVMISILLGDKYRLFVNPLHIHNLTGILISFKDLITFTDNFDTFTTLVFMIPYFLVIKYTILYMIIAIIYNSISVAKANVKAREKIEAQSMSLSEFLKRTAEAVIGGSGESKNDAVYTVRYLQSLNFNSNIDVFNKIVDSFHYTENKNEKATWKRLLGDSAIKEYFERENISIKHQTIIFKLIGFMVENQKNLFLSVKKNQKDFDLIVKKIITFYKSFFNYFKFGNKTLVRQIDNEMAKGKYYSRKSQNLEGKESKRLKIKRDLLRKQVLIDEMIAKICIYRLIIKFSHKDSKRMTQLGQSSYSRQKVPSAFQQIQSSKSRKKSDHISPNKREISQGQRTHLQEWSSS